VQSAADVIHTLTDDQRWETLFRIEEDIRQTEEYDKPILMMARAIKDQFGDELANRISRHLYSGLSRLRILPSRLRSELVKYRNKKPGTSEESVYEALARSASRLMKAIVRLARSERDTRGVQAIINYNFDDLVERCLSADNVRCVTVCSGKDKVPDGTLPVYHVHGILRFKDYMDRRLSLLKR